MRRDRAFRYVIGALALASVSKLAVSATAFLQPYPVVERDIGSSFFIGAASAASETDAPAAETPLNESTGTDAAAIDAPIPDGTPEDMLAAIATERKLLDAQRAVIAQRNAEIALANAALEVETARLDELKQEVEALLERANAAHVADVDRLVGLYAAMKPKDAATIMNDLDLEVTIAVLGTMPERGAAPIMAALDPVRARALSLILLERSKLPGDRRLDRIRLH